MGIFSKPKQKFPPQPVLSGEGQKYQGMMYGDVMAGMEGKGYGPWNIKDIGDIGRAYKKAMPEARTSLERNLNRFIPRGDVKVRGHARGMLNRGFYGMQHELSQRREQVGYEGMLAAQETGVNLLAGEKQVATNLAAMQNQYLQQQAGMPTFASQMGYGIGGAAGWAAYAQMMNNAQGGIS